MKISIVQIVLFSIFIFANLFNSNAFAAEEKATKSIILKLASPFPPMDLVNVQFKAYADKFNEKSKGQYVIQVHDSETLLKIGESIDVLRTGGVEMAAWPIPIFASLDQRFGAASIPFLVNNVEADAEMQVKLLSHYNAILEEKFNSKALFSFTCLALDICSTKQIREMNDMKGLVIHSISPQTANFIRLLGASDVAMPFPEAYQALQKKVVDTTMQSSVMILGFKLFEVAKHVIRGYLIPASIIVAINKDNYKKLPQNIQNELIEIGKIQQKEANTAFINFDKEINEELKKNGVDLYVLPKRERELWAEKVYPYNEKIYKSMGEEFSNVVKTISKEVNEIYPYKN